jgi:hypothetical protein
MSRSFTPLPSELFRSQVQRNCAQGISKLLELRLLHDGAQTGFYRAFDRPRTKASLSLSQELLIDVDSGFHRVGPPSQFFTWATF